MSRLGAPAARYFSLFEAERTDDLGFLDELRSPRLCRVTELLALPVAWVIGPPWLGKSTAAAELLSCLRADPAPVPGLGGRVTLTRLGSPGAAREVPPAWWADWLQSDPPAPAAWLVDGVEEALGTNDQLLDALAEAVEAVPVDHLRRLRLVLFSRPYAELDHLRDRLQRRFSAVTDRTRLPHYWLARLDRAAAVAFVGQDRFAAVEDLVRRHNLQSVAGYPVVLNYLKTYHREAERLTVPGVWRGVLTALLGEPESHRRLAFDSTPEERFEAACRIAAVLTLTGQEGFRRRSPDPDEVTTGVLFQTPDNRKLTAAREVCESAMFVRSEQPPAFRFAHRNARDWLTAFALAGLPLPALRSALADGDGRMEARVREVARLLRALRTDAPARVLLDRLSGGVVLPSDAIEPSLTEVLRALDHLEELAAASPWGLRVGFDRADDLARLRVTGLGDRLAERLRGPSRPARVKVFLVDVALATNAVDAVEAAVELVLDRAQADELREAAVHLVTHLGGPAHLDVLAGPIGEGEDAAEIECRLRGILVRELLTRGLWPRWRAALRTPRVNPDLIDSRFLVLRWVEEGLTVADARHLLPHLRELFGRHAEEHRPHDLPAYLLRAVELVLGGAPPAAADLDALLAFVFDAAGDAHGWSAAREVAVRVRHIASARRRLYRHDVEAGAALRIQAWNLLEPEDWRWLRDQALGEWGGNREVWGYAHWLAGRAREGGQLGEAEWDQFVLQLDEHAAGLRDEFEEGRRRYAQELAEEEARRQAREARDPTRRPLADRVRDVLDRPELTGRARVLELSWLCFENMPGPRPAAGRGWIDLPADLRGCVLDLCAGVLEAAAPTPIPTTGSFSGATLAEGEAFAHVVGSSEHAARVTPPTIRRWLPTTLFARMSGDWAGPIAACGAVARAETEAALLDTITFHARHDARPFVLRQIPAVWWTVALTDRLAELAADETVTPSARGELIDQLAARDPERAAPAAAEWAARPVSADDADILRRAGRNLLLTRDPAAALELIEADFAVRGTAALEELSALADDGFAGGWAGWPLPHLERLGGLLVRAYPLDTDPASRSGFVTAAQELRWLRDRLVANLLDRAGGGAPAVLDRWSDLDPQVRARVDAHRANERAAQFLPGVRTAAPCDPTALLVRDAVRLLDRTGFRLIRSPADLLDAVLESLRTVDAAAGHDLPMLYAAPNRSGRKGAARSGPRKHLEEDAFQAYLRRRLLDELAALTDGVDVQIVREDEVSRRQRLDLRVTAPCHGSGRLATVVVEVKWSTNEETRTGLVEQLGARYLLGEGLTHGVFVVGWCGEWFPRDGSGRNTDPAALATHLIAQRDAYCAAGRPGTGLTIEPFVLDLRWSRTSD